MRALSNICYRPTSICLSTGGGGSGPAGGGSDPATGGGVRSSWGGGGQVQLPLLGGQVQLPGGGSGPAGGGQVKLAGGGGSAKIEQHREYLLHGGRYASCVHAGGLSCYNLKSNCTTYQIFGVIKWEDIPSMARMSRI